MQQKLLITGCHRSGTTLLAAMVGCHKDIAIIYQDYYDSFSRILSKKYIGTKMTIPSILFNKKRSKIYISIFRKISKVRRLFFAWRHPAGTCNYSISDFLTDGKIIFISRSDDENIKSILRWTRQIKRTAQKDVQFANSIKKKLEGHSNVFFVEMKNLTKNPEGTMKDICNFLEIEYDNSMVQGYKYTRQYNYGKIEEKS